MTTKRTMGQCQCNPARAMEDKGLHYSYCPALYPLQPQPGDEKDALTRLVAHVRNLEGVVPNGHDTALSLDLISEAREEQNRARDSADTDFSGLSRAIARNEPLPTCNSAGGIVIAAELYRLHAELNKATSDLRLCQAKMGEARQQAQREARDDVFRMTEDEFYEAKRAYFEGGR